MRVFSLTILAVLLACSPSNAHVRQGRKLQFDTLSPTATPGSDGETAPPTPLDSDGGDEGTPNPGDGGDGPTPSPVDGLDAPTPSPVGDGDGIGVPTPAPVDDGSVIGVPTPAPVDDGLGGDESGPPADDTGFGGDGGDGVLTPTPAPVDEPTFDEPTFDEPTFDEPTFDEPTFDEPTFDEPTFDEPSEPPVFPTFAPITSPPEPAPTEAPAVPYVANDDDPLQDEDIEIEENEWGDNETLEEMEHDQNVLIALSVVGAIGLCFALICSQQLIENPEGCCASICRMFVACICGITRCLCWPCRAICGCTGRDRRNHDLIQAGDNNYTHDLELS